MLCHPCSALCQHVWLLPLQPLKLQWFRTEFCPGHLRRKMGRQQDPSRSTGFATGHRIYRALVKLCFCKEHHLFFLHRVCKHAVLLLVPELAQQSGKVFLRGSEGPSVSSGSLLLLFWAFISAGQGKFLLSWKLPQQRDECNGPWEMAWGWEVVPVPRENKAFVPQKHNHHEMLFYSQEKKPHSFMGKCGLFRNTLLVFNPSS